MYDIIKKNRIDSFVVIAIPMILNVVDKSKKKAVESSAYGYLEFIEKQIMINTMNKTDEIKDGEYDI